MLFNKLADIWSWRNVSRGCASYRWPLSLTRARSTAIRLLVGNSADPEIVSTTPLAWPRDAQSRAEEGRSGSEREEEAGICERSRRKNIHGIGYRDFPRVIACFLSPRQLESRIRFSPIFASSGVCIIGWVVYRGYAGRKQKQKSSQQGRLEFSSFADFPLAPQMQSRCSAKFLLSTFEFYAKFEISRLELKFMKY